ncbi:MAG: KH domain-containing protein [Anaerolineae bacterium]
MTPENTQLVFTGKNVDAAIEAGLAALGLRREDVEVEVLHPGSRGLLGIGAQDARVRLIPIPRPKPQPTQPVEVSPAPAPKPPQPASAPISTAEAVSEMEEILEEARELLQGLIDHMGITATVRTRIVPPEEGQDQPSMVLNIEGQDLGILIGRRGETLMALQYLTRLMVNHRRHRWVNIIVDVEEYRMRRDRHLRDLALRMAEKVVQTGKPVKLEAMPPRERRIIHITLRDHPHVTTQSIGEGENRKVMIRPR